MAGNRAPKETVSLEELLMSKVIEDQFRGLALFYQF